MSEESKSRQGSSLKGAARYLATPGMNKIPRDSYKLSVMTHNFLFFVGMISLGGGLPSSDYFPFEYIEMKVPTIGKFSEAETAESGKVVRIGKHDVKEGKSAFDLAISLNYGQGTGSAQILRWFTEHTEVGIFYIIC